MRIILIFFLFLAINLSGQKKVRFSDISLNSAIQRAKIENKLIFIDAYASYCIPCKRMELEFKKPSVAAYYNANFINVKVDLEGPNGDEYKSQFQIVFLPTFIFLDPNGNERTKIDNILTAAELLSIAKFVDNKFKNPTLKTSKSNYTSTQITKSADVSTIQEKASVNKETTIVINKTKKKPTVSKIIESNSKEKILYVMGQDEGDLPPLILRKEAYFRMQLMDGSHIKKAEEYLATQSDWLTQENIRFVFDFLHSSQTKSFKHMIAHRGAYNEVLGKKTVDKSIYMLIKKALERAYPKPSSSEAKKLLSLLDKVTAQSLVNELSDTSYYKL